MLLFFLLIALLHHPRVQTFATRKAAKYLSEKLHAKVKVGAVDIDFFKTVVLDSVYIEDQHGKTLLYAEQLKAEITLFSFNNSQLDFDKLNIHNATFNLRKYKGEEDLNIKFIIDELTSKDTVPSNWKININEIFVSDSKFTYQDENIDNKEYGVDFNDLDLTKLNFHIDNIELGKEDVYARIKQLSFTEKSGFSVSHLQAMASVSKQMLDFKKVLINTQHSNISSDISFSYNSFSEFKEFNTKVILKSRFKETSFNMSDIAYFAPELQGLKKQITLSGNIKGTIAQLKGTGLSILVEDNTYFEGNASMSGLPNIYETYIDLDVERLSTTKHDLDRIPLPPFNQKKFIETPANLGLLGTITFKGNINGFINDFVSYGTLYTSLGNISSDLSLRFDKETGRSSYKGYVATQSFNAGKFFNVPDLGAVSLSANVDGKGFKPEHLKIDVNGNVSSLAYKNYNYKNIKVEGNIAKRLFQGHLLINDPNLAMDFRGEVNFQKELPVFHFVSDITNAQFVHLNLSKRDTSARLKAKLTFDFTGNELDNIIGNAVINELTYSESGKTYTLDKASLTAEKTGDQKTLSLRSDVADANINGHYDLKNLGASFKIFFKELVADETSESTKQNNSTYQDFIFDINLKNIKPLTELFLPSLKVDPATKFNGKFSSLTNTFTVTGNSSQVVYRGARFNNFFIDAKTESNSLILKTGSKKLMFSDSVWVDDFNVTAQTYNDSIGFGIKWDTQREDKYSGDIKGYANLRSIKDFTVKILPSEIYITDTLWSINDRNEIKYDSTGIHINDLFFSTVNQSVLLDGIISKKPDELLNITFDNFKLANFNPITAQENIKLGGLISGTGTVSNVFNSAALTSNLKIQNFKFNNEEIGDGEFITSWNSKSESIIINAKIFRDNLATVNLTGDYYPYRKEDNLDLNVRVNKLRIKVLERFLQGVFTNINGIASGNIALRGKLSEPRMRGKLNLQKAGFTVDYLKTSYSFSDDVIIEPTWFGMNNITLFDELGNEAKVTGTIFHKNFKEWNLDIGIDAKNFMALNTKETDNPLYFGTAFMSGNINLSGYTNTIVIIDIKARTEKGTQFNFPLSGAEEITQNTFITFVKKDTSTIAVNKKYDVNLEGIQMNFDLDITPDAEVLLIFDPKIGDVMRGRGHGAITMNINTIGNFNMYGEYIIEEGDYLFTFANLINKKFRVEKGGRILFNGDIYKSLIDIEATYSLRAGIRDLGFQGMDEASQNRRIPVDLTMKLKNELMKPEIAFDINFTSGTPENMKSQLRSIIADEEERNRQAFALLTFNRFVPPSGTANQVALNAGQAGTASGAEVLSNQVSNWFSKFSTELDIGIKYLPGDDETGVGSETEVGVSHRVNDRLSLEGNLGVKGQQPTDQNANNLVGEFNVEYKLSEDGRFRVKAFNKANSTTQFGANNPYTQGVGIFYRVEFETFKDLFRKYWKSKPDEEISPEEEIKPEETTEKLK